MKILHLCLSNFYIDGYGYQENYLPIMNQKDGHDVMIIASTETYVEGKYHYLEPSSYLTETNIPITRIPYAGFPHTIAKKIRHYVGLEELLYKIDPDVILFHGVCAYDIKVVARFKQQRPNLKFYVDSHTGLHNSASNFISKNVLHKGLYKSWLHQALPYIGKVFYIGLDEKKYLEEIMGIPEDRMEYYPLGGIVIDETEKYQRRKKVVAAQNFCHDNIIFVHSGKLDEKKRTDSLLRAFTKVKDQRFRLLIIGSVNDEYHDILLPLVSGDNRIKMLGWKSREELLDYLCAADMYLQPGSVSATLQNAICCGTPVMTYPHGSYKYFVNDNAVTVKDEDDIYNVLVDVSNSKYDLDEMSKASYSVAREILDYRMLATRLYR